MPMRRPLRSLIVLALAGALSLLAMPAVAQDGSPAPDPAAALAGSAFAEVFPTDLGGLPWDEFSVNVGAENVADLDPSDPDDAEEIADLEALLDPLGATVEDLTAVTASRVSEDFTEYAMLGAFNVAGVDADQLLEAMIPLFTKEIDEPRQETRQIGGKDLILLSEASSPEAQPFYLYASGDTVWMAFSSTESVAAELFGLLP